MCPPSYRPIESPEAPPPVQRALLCGQRLLALVVSPVFGSGFRAFHGRSSCFRSAVRVFICSIISRLLLGPCLFSRSTLCKWPACPSQCTAVVQSPLPHPPTPPRHQAETTTVNSRLSISARYRHDFIRQAISAYQAAQSQCLGRSYCRLFVTVSHILRMNKGILLAALRPAQTDPRQGIRTRESMTPAPYQVDKQHWPH